MDNTKKLLVTLGMIGAMLGGDFMNEAYEFMDDELKAPEGDDKNEPDKQRGDGHNFYCAGAERRTDESD